MSERHDLCLWCIHFRMDFGDDAYSELTPETAPSLYCRKDVWVVRNPRDLTLSEYRDIITKGLDCKHHEEE